MTEKPLGQVIVVVGNTQNLTGGERSQKLKESVGVYENINDEIELGTLLGKWKQH